MNLPAPPTDPAYFDAANDKHAAMTQLHRWWLIYESPQPEIHFDILSDDIVVDSATGQLKGLEAYKKRLIDFKGWKNAHHLQNSKVWQKNAQEIELQAEIVYQNIRPDGQKLAYLISYEATLEKQKGQLPRFKLIKLRPLKTLDDTTFVSAYEDNRLRSFTHYWLYLMETAHGDAKPFQELLSSKFSLAMGGPQPYTKFADFAAWYKSVPSWLAKSSHTVQNMEAKAVGENLINAKLSFDWQGLSRDGKPMVARTAHQWVLEDQASRRFPTMKEMKVDVLVPFQKVQ